MIVETLTLAKQLMPGKHDQIAEHMKTCQRASGFFPTVRHSTDTIYGCPLSFITVSFPLQGSAAEVNDVRYALRAGEFFCQFGLVY